MAIDGNQMIAAGVGAGAKGMVAGLVAGMTPLKGVTPDIMTGGVGYLMADRMKGFGGDFGMGMLIASIGQMVRAPIEGLFAKTTITPTPTPEQPATQLATNKNPANVSVDDYITAKYAIA